MTPTMRARGPARAIALVVALASGFSVAWLLSGPAAASPSTAPPTTTAAAPPPPPFGRTPSLPRCTISGTARPDVLRGTRRADVLCGADGRDRIAAGGSDTVIAGRGDDTILARNGRADVVFGGPGVDRASLDAGIDLAYGVERRLGVARSRTRTSTTVAASAVRGALGTASPTSGPRSGRAGGNAGIAVRIRPGEAHDDRARPAGPRGRARVADRSDGLVPAHARRQDLFQRRERRAGRRPLLHRHGGGRQRRHHGGALHLRPPGRVRDQLDVRTAQVGQERAARTLGGTRGDRSDRVGRGDQGGARRLRTRLRVPDPAAERRRPERRRRDRHRGDPDELRSARGSGASGTPPGAGSASGGRRAKVGIPTTATRRTAASTGRSPTPAEVRVTRSASAAR